MEFLMTYGWAILAVLIIIGVLFFSGSLTDPTRFMKEECKFYITVVCLDHLVEKDEITLSVKNEAEREIIVENIIATSNALDGQCELTGIHRGKHLKNGEDFLFDLNITNAATIGLDPPESAGISWNLPDDEILLAQAQTPQEVSILHSILTGTNVPSEYSEDRDQFSVLLNGDPDPLSSVKGLSPASQDLFTHKLGEVNPAYYANLYAYKTAVIELLDEILDNATHKNYTAYTISNETNKSDSATTKGDVWNIILQETEDVFLYELDDDISLTTYNSRWEANDGSVEDVRENTYHLGCEHLSSQPLINHVPETIRRRLNYAAHNIFTNVSAAAYDSDLNREGLSDNLSASIENVKQFYRMLIHGEKAGSNEMSSKIKATFETPPFVSDADKSRLITTPGGGCADADTFDISELETLNSETAFTSLHQATANSGTLHYRSTGELVEYVSKRDFSDDAYCVLGSLVKDITVLDDGRVTGARNNFNRDGSVDSNEDDPEYFDFLGNLRSIDRLTNVSVAAYNVSVNLNTPEDYRYLNNFNGADVKKIKDIFDHNHVSMRADGLILYLDRKYLANQKELGTILPYYDPSATYYLKTDDSAEIKEIMRRKILYRSNQDYTTTVEVADRNRIHEILYSPSNSVEDDDKDRILEIFNSDGLVGEADMREFMEIVYRSNGLVEGSDDENRIIEILDRNNVEVGDKNRILAILKSNRNNYASRYCMPYFDYLNNWGLGSYQIYTQDDNELTLYLNELYEPGNPESSLYTIHYDEVDSNTLLIDNDLYYQLLYEVLIYDAANAVSNSGTAEDRADKFKEINESIIKASNLFVFGFVKARADKVKSEYMSCYDTSKLFQYEGSDDPSLYANYCSADYVRSFFSRFTYADIFELSDGGEQDFGDFIDNMDVFYQKRLETIRKSVFDSLDHIESQVIASLPNATTVCQAANATAVQHKDVHSPDFHPARKSASVELIADFNTRIPIIDLLNSDGNLNCMLLNSHTSVSVPDILEAVGKAANEIIEPAQEDIEAVPPLRYFINRWGLSDPPTVEITSPDANSRISPSFTIEITVEDEDGDLNRLELNIINDNYTAKKKLLTYEIDPSQTIQTIVLESDEFKITQHPCSLSGVDGKTCNVEIDVSEGLISLLKQNPDDPDEDLVINIVAKVTDEHIPAGVGRDSVTGLEISSTPPPVVESFEIRSMEHIKLEGGEYYTQAVVEVNATQRGDTVNGITLSLPSEPVDGLNSHLNTQGMTETNFKTDLEANLSFFNYAANQLPGANRPDGNAPPAWILPPDWDCGTGDLSTVGDVTTCTKRFTITLSKELNNNVIWLTAKAGSPGVESDAFNKKLRIPPESIPACQYIDTGKNKNRYDLKLIYAWAESPGIFHTVTGTMLANSPE